VILRCGLHEMKDLSVLYDRIADCIGYGFRVLMLPEAQDGPAGSAQTSVRVGVTCPVRLDLARPVLGIRLGRDVMIAATVPIASIYEHGYALAHEEKVSRPPEVGYRSLGHAIPKASRVDRPAHPQFGTRVS